MAELIADLFVSIDGFARGVEVGPYFGYGGDELDAWITREVGRPQVLVMGRVTYELMAGLSATATDTNSVRTNETPKVVVSRTLHEPLDWQNTRLVRDLADGIGALKRESDVPLRTIGSLSLVRGLVELGLVDRLRVMVFPMMVGDDGRELAFDGFARGGFELAGTEVLDSRIVLLEYRPAVR
ncbi:dihydrofolate reductase family protein [Winogradskya humida]|uniref:Bacterial bifunctional deaminase-reductase C-terminal domain-containing protein n=1 Tax=Winogradskya humida TaxID=113566 RepID=A0ABQ3ZGK0_9ACTN|nr:dihydrofolate reductase family protein [Actinoplanes humidus]GIE17687.1 hypothetical protein Ahu01nite_007890 [Actinoplanes humidus]